MTGNPRLSTRSLRPAAVLWGAAATCYLATEAVAASAFPGYSYGRNYISDLGIPDRETIGPRMIDSPLATVMNVGFVVQGALFALAAVLAVRALRRRHGPAGPHRVLILFALGHAVGNVLVAVVHSGAPSAESGVSLHTVGAGMAIVGGNLAVLTAGVVLRRHRLAGPLATAGIVLGVAGLVALVGLLVVTTVSPGWWERGAVYAITLWESLAALALLLERRRPAA